MVQLDLWVAGLPMKGRAKPAPRVATGGWVCVVDHRRVVLAVFGTANLHQAVSLASKIRESRGDNAARVARVPGPRPSVGDTIT